MNEFEKKLLLSKEEYDHLKEYFGHDGLTTSKLVIKQINYYYDTDDLSMNRQNTTCRIRFKEGEYKGTIKRHSIDFDHSTETDIAVYDGIIKNAFIDMGLTLKGELFTERRMIWKDTACEVVLDKNIYLDHEDYELEIEYEPMFEQDAARNFKKILNLLKTHIPSQRVQSKSERFFARYLSKERR